MSNKINLTHLSGAFDNLANGGPPAAGHYVARITATEINNSKKGDPQVVYDLLIVILLVLKIKNEKLL